MPLVDYTSSSSDDGDLQFMKDNRQIGKKRKAQDALKHDKRKPVPPPLPESFHSLYAANVRTSTSDDPTLHAGRTRQVPHVVGNWPTHVYLEWYPSQSELAVLDRVIQTAGSASASIAITSNLQSFLRSELAVQLPLHISLSAPLFLRTEHKNLFQTMLDSKMSNSQIKSFEVEVTSLDWVANHDRSRYFLVLRLSRPQNDELNRLLSICNETTHHFGLPQLYENDHTPPLDLQSRPDTKAQQNTNDKSDAFHISIAWTLHEPGDANSDILTDAVESKLRDLKVSFSLLKTKIGNTVIDLPLGHAAGKS